MVAPMRLPLIGLLLATALLPAAATPAAGPVAIPPMKTSIYVGSVTLETTVFTREGAAYSATYEARVWPWFFWSETGRITILVPDTDLARLAAGETIEFAGDALNHKNKPRRVTGRAQPAAPGRGEGRIKVRIGVDDTELIFNGAYRFEAAPAP